MRSVFLHKQLQHSQVLSLLCHYYACTPQKSAGKILSVSSTFGSRSRRQRRPKVDEKKVRSQYAIRIFTQTIAALTSVVTPLPLPRLRTTNICLESAMGIVPIRKQEWEDTAAAQNRKRGLDDESVSHFLKMRRHHLQFPRYLNNYVACALPKIE